MYNHNQKNDGFISISKIELESICSLAIEKIVAYREAYEKNFIEQFRLKYNLVIDGRIKRDKNIILRFLRKITLGEPPNHKKLETFEDAKNKLDKLGKQYMRFNGYIDEEYEYHCWYGTNTEKSINNLLMCCRSQNVQDKIDIDTTLFAAILKA
jgi:hypothetical protein